MGESVMKERRGLRMNAAPFRIIQISDLHGNTSVIESITGEIMAADLLVLSGDITHFGGRLKAAEVMDTILKLNIPTVGVPGNCDRRGAALYLEQIGVSVDGILREIAGFRVYGMGGSLPTPAPTPKVYREGEFGDRLTRFLEEKGSPDIVVIHQPPADSALDRIHSGSHVGSPAVRKFIERSGALLCLTGHIHESFGTETIGRTLVVNPGAGGHGRYAVIEIREKIATAELKTAPA